VSKRFVLAVSEWLRQRRRNVRSLDAKLRSIRSAAAITSAPAPHIEQMLEETERGYLRRSS
jgi:hypothetical protein